MLFHAKPSLRSQLAAVSAKPTQALLLGLVLTLASTAVWGTDIIGRVKTTHGNVFIISEGVSTPAKPGSYIRAQDTLITGSGGSVGLTLRDRTRISLGPTSALLMKEFKFEPLENEHLFVARMNKGSLLYESDMEDKVAFLETPNSTIGIRGTRFLLRVEDE